MGGKSLESRIKSLAQTQAPAPQKLPELKQPRASARVDAFKFGEILYGISDKVACVVQDCSDEGLRVKLQSGCVLPDQVKISISSAGLHSMANVVWQKNDLVGLNLVRR